ESWKNLAFSSELRSSQNEGTYVTHVIAPSIRAVLKDLPFGKSSYISMAEKQSVASAERKGEGYLGKKPDTMFILNQEERETNDGMDWVRNKCKPAKGKFGIVGIQEAGNVLKLNVLVRDEADENAEHKVRIEELEKNSADISAENAELKAELAKLRHDFNSSNLTRLQQLQHVTNAQNSCSGEEKISE
ncbi:11345_t:CDS:2, partial [Cetraspora pellucida]